LHGHLLTMTPHRPKPPPNAYPPTKLSPEVGGYTPAKVDSRRCFKQAEVFPQIVNSDYGDTFWIWDRDQTPRTLI